MPTFSHPALERHNADSILEAVASSAKELLNSRDFESCLPEVIARVGKATGSDRVHILAIDPATPDRGRVVRQYLWNTRGISMPASLAGASRSSMIEVGLQSWLKPLADGESIVGDVTALDRSARDFLASLGVLSIAVVPIFVDAKWWGQIGLHDCRTERAWSPAELDAIKTLAELIGAAIARARRIETLADASRIVESSPTLLYRVEPTKPFPLIYLSQNIRRYGYEADEFKALPGGWLQVIERDYHPAVIADFESIAEGRVAETHVEFRARQPDGKAVWFDGHAYAVRDEKGRLTAIEGILSDITERKIAAEKIAALARTDSLTNLANRASFLERLALEFAQSRRSGRQFAVHYLDLDHFKDVNDTLGHPIGDALLRAVAERLRRCVRAVDTVARFGGDEFAILQAGIADSSDAETLAAKIARVLTEPYALDGHDLRTSTSIGIVPYRADIDSPDAMMTKADLALYRAKNEGRNQFRFHIAELDEETRDRVMIGEDLHMAVARGELELFYQPQIEIASGRIVALEAMLRWHHPTRGLLLPAAFIPIAERTGTIGAIGAWMIERVCRQIRAWKKRAVAPPIVALDLSGTQFKVAADFDETVAACLARFQIAPEQIEFDLTETALADAARRHGRSLQRLREIGVRIGLDDFGSGEFSLGSLRAFGVSRLKLDGRIVEGAMVHADDAAIVRAAVALARELDIAVVAGGVETAPQVAFLVSAGCTIAQGAYFGTPLPTIATTESLQENFSAAAA
ncbi:MAG TPA: EAL domain-containing protein [Beijerinckiaceae bacterium]|nr:EAL domain-containing protein [Beijerinckiaceae bacterium]